jgi:hypothetical protein
MRSRRRSRTVCAQLRWPSRPVDLDDDALGPPQGVDEQPLDPGVAFGEREVGALAQRDRAPFGFAPRAGEPRLVVSSIDRAGWPTA